MSSGFRPNDQMRLPTVGVPIDPWTGFHLDPVMVARHVKLREAEQAFRLVLHELDGSTMGSRPGDRRMAMAFTKFDETLMWVSAAILDHHEG